jgi:UDP-N-acetylmuramoyl-L-alanyl-D-glutamate--2,6-diaminopimelate ligase
MLLDDLLSGAEVIRRDSAPESGGLKISGLAYDSRRVEPGFLFAAVPGFKVDGHGFIGQALRAGAAAAVTEHWIEDAGIPQIQVASVRKTMPLLACNFFGHPSRNLTLAGVTGTNGKTTTTFLIDAILRQAGMRTGLLGGIEYRIGENSIPAKRTTPEAFDLQRLLAEINDNEITAVTMEVSSHGIDLYRVGCLEFDVAVFTNLTRDHLDQHGGMEHYYQVKRSLFTGSLDDPGNPVAAIAPDRPMSVVNIDDRYGHRLAGELRDRLVTFGLNPAANVRAGSIEYCGWETGFELMTPTGKAPVRLHLPGAYNLENALAAAAAATALSFPLDIIAAGLTAARGVPGRFELVNIDAPFRVVIDYAHNEDGLTKALTTARALTPGRLIVVFGSPGERDRDKRPGMGKIAGTLSDLAILTTDDCYSEPPQQILDEIEPGLVQTDVEFQRIPDRWQAIETAMAAAAHGDTVLITGKGHETSQMMSSGPVPFSDRNVVREIFAARRKN